MAFEDIAVDYFADGM